MPAQITHYLCGQAVLSALPYDTSITIRKYHNLYNVGAQGPDIFFYYITGMLKKRFRGMAHKMHGSNVGNFIRAMAEGLKDMPQELTETREASLAYFCGYLTHYCLDCATHPYVYFKTGFKKQGEKGSRLKYSAYHVRFETSIDTLMLKLIKGIEPKEQNFWRIIKTTKKEAATAADFIGDCITKAYKIPTLGKNVISAMEHMVFITRIIQSNKGRRKRLLAFAESMIYKEQLFSSLIHQQKVDDGLDYLNEKKTPWNVPWDKNISSDSSFQELFNIGINESINLINLLQKYLNAGLAIEEFLNAAGDRSLNSGQPIGDNIIFKHHDIIYRS